MNPPVVIVGGGLAGLSCAVHLQEEGIPSVLLEASDRVGGRLKTDLVDGLRLDRGFQVFFEGYASARKLLDYEALQFRAFPRGAEIFDGTAFHTLDLAAPLASALDPYIPLSDKLKLLRLALQLKRGETLVNTDSSTLAYLGQRAKLSERVIDRFLRPFFGGVFLDPQLAVSAKQFEFVLRTILSGNVVVPNEGMEEIPKQLVSRLPNGTVHTYAPVTEFSRDANGRVTGVRLQSNEAILADQVVLATDQWTSAKLLGQHAPAAGKTSTVLYFETPGAVARDKRLRLNGSGTGIMNEVALMTNVAEGYAPSGRDLLSATVLGSPEVDDDKLFHQVQAELHSWFPDCPVASFKPIRLYRVFNAQYDQAPGFEQARQVVETAGLIVAGEATTNSSIDGAIESGIRAAKIAHRNRGNN